VHVERKVPETVDPELAAKSKLLHEALLSQSYWSELSELNLNIASSIRKKWRFLRINSSTIAVGDDTTLNLRWQMHRQRTTLATVKNPAGDLTESPMGSIVSWGGLWLLQFGMEYDTSPWCGASGSCCPVSHGNKLVFVPHNI